MYVPPHFAAAGTDEAALALMAEHPFATLVATDRDGAPFVSHLPLLVEQDGAKLRITGHMARANPQWRLLAERPEALAIFLGPHAYVTSRWYEAFDVPTWNYAVVHARGAVRLIEEPRRLVRLLAHLAERFEAGAAAPWRFGLPEDLQGEGALAAAIVGFELVEPRLEVKLKLSQNRSAEDQARVVRGLAAERTDDASRGVRALMLKVSGIRAEDP